MEIKRGYKILLRDLTDFGSNGKNSSVLPRYSLLICQYFPVAVWLIVVYVYLVSRSATVTRI
jgi:hypothetical protein